MIALPLTFKLLEPVLVSAPGGDPNSNQSLSYLPGTAIRGAMVRAYLQAHPGQALPAWFLNGEVRFLNAYPYDQDFARSQPLPVALVKNKYQKKEELLETEDRIVNRLTAPLPEAPKSIGRRFGWFNNGTVVIAEPVDEISVHNSRDRQLGKAGDPELDQEGAVFQFRTLSAGEMFAGAILAPEKYANELNELAALAEARAIRLGGSATAGHGLVQVKAAKISNEWHEVDPPVEKGVAQGESFTLVLLSDAILRDENGQLGDHLEYALIRRLGAGSVRLKAAYSRLDWVGGFNRKWGLPLPQDWAASAGSSYKLEALRALSADELAQLEAEGVGERRAEGFGRLVINWGLLDEYQLEKKQDTHPSLPKGPFNLTPAEEKLADLMLTRWLRQQLDRATAAAITKAMQTIPNRRSVRNSQVARLRLQCRQAARQKNMQPIIDYLDRVQKRSTSRDQLQAVRINDADNLLTWITQWAVEPPSPKIWKALDVKEPKKSYVIVPGTGPLDWQGNLELRREYILRFVDGVLSRLMKQKREGA